MKGVHTAFRPGICLTGSVASSPGLWKIVLCIKPLQSFEAGSASQACQATPYYKQDGPVANGHCRDIGIEAGSAVAALARSATAAYGLIQVDSCYLWLCWRLCGVMSAVQALNNS